MRLTLHTDYALRMLIYLALHDGKPCRVSDDASSYGGSRNHLLKVAVNLGRLGQMTTARGRSGGIARARPPKDINLGEVVRHMEDGFDPPDCRRQCCSFAITPSCRLKGIVGRALDAFLSVFDSFMLADITEKRSELAELVENA